MALIDMGLGAAIGLAVAAPVAVLALRSLERRTRLAERRAARSERLAEIGAMTDGLAHEIRNPLSTVGLNAELLAESIDEHVPDQDEREAMRRRVESIGREADRLRDILHDFMRYAGKLHVELREADLNHVAEEMIDFYQPQAEHHNVRLRSDLSPTPLPVRTDVNQLKQALLNLMMNATQAMAPDGPPPPYADRPRDAPVGELILRARQQGDDCVLHVIDTGPGIPDDARERIFHPYFSTKSAGTGLGLPTSKRIVEALGGTLDLHTEPGKGTDFTITPAPNHRRVTPQRAPRPNGCHGLSRRATRGERSVT